MATIAQATPALRGRVAHDAEHAVGSRPTWVTNAVLYIALTVPGIMFTLPFLWLVMTTFKPAAEVFSESWIPTTRTTGKYEDVFQQASVGRWMGSSAQIAVLGVISVLLSSSLVAHAFARPRFRGRNRLFALVIGTCMVPAAVTMVPTFLIWNKLGLIGMFSRSGPAPCSARPSISSCCTRS